MAFSRLVLLCSIIGTSVSACDSDVTSVAEVDRQLIVEGPSEGIDRFVALQGSRRPVLPTSTPTKLESGDHRAVVSFPRGYDGTDLVHTTREALAAGLSYEFVDVRTTVTTKS